MKTRRRHVWLPIEMIGDFGTSRWQLGWRCYISFASRRKGPRGFFVAVHESLAGSGAEVKPVGNQRRYAYLPSFRILVASFTRFRPSLTISERCGPGRRLPAFVSGPQFTASGPSCSLGHDVTAAEIDAGGGEGAVRLLGGGGGRDGGPGLKLAPVGHLQTRNRHARADDDLLLAVPVFHRRPHC